MPRRRLLVAYFGGMHAPIVCMHRRYACTAGTHVLIAYMYRQYACNGGMHTSVACMHRRHVSATCIGVVHWRHALCKSGHCTNSKHMSSSYSSQFMGSQHSMQGQPAYRQTMHARSVHAQPVHKQQAYKQPALQPAHVASAQGGGMPHHRRMVAVRISSTSNNLCYIKIYTPHFHHTQLRYSHTHPNWSLLGLSAPYPMIRSRLYMYLDIHKERFCA